MDWQQRVIDKLTKFTEETNAKIEKLNQEMKIVREKEEAYKKNPGYKNVNSSNTIVQGEDNLKDWAMGSTEANETE